MQYVDIQIDEFERRLRLEEIISEIKNMRSITLKLRADMKLKLGVQEYKTDITNKLKTLR